MFGFKNDSLDLKYWFTGLGKLYNLIFYIIKQNKKNLWNGSTVEFSFQC